MNKYEDIMNKKRPESINHEKMPIEKRASIFAPFAALAGFSDKIKKVENDNALDDGYNNIKK